MVELRISGEHGPSEIADIAQFRQLSERQYNSIGIMSGGEISGLEWFDVTLENVLDFSPARDGAIVLRDCSFRKIQAYQFDFGRVKLENCRFEGIRVKQWKLRRSEIRNCHFSGKAQGTVWFAGDGADKLVMEGNDFTDLDFGEGLRACEGLVLRGNKFRLGGDGILIADRRPVIPCAVEIVRAEWEESKLRDKLIRSLGWDAEDGAAGQLEWYVSKPLRRSFPWDDYLAVLKRAATEADVEFWA